MEKRAYGEKAVEAAHRRQARKESGRRRPVRESGGGSGEAIHTFLLKILRFGIYFLITYVYIQSRRFIRETYMKLRAAGERTAAGGVSAMAGVINAAAGERAAVRPAGFAGGTR